MAADAPIVIRPQKGPQEQFLASPADIAIYGGGAGGGKTWALLLEPLRHIKNPEFGAVFFRRQQVQITNEGGLWDAASKVYPALGATKFKAPKAKFVFPGGSQITLDHLDDVDAWQGSEIPLLCFDELTHFTRKQFFYMLSRNRSTSGVRPYVRATCNPDADSWVATFLAWWINQDTGYPIPERSGVLRWFGVVNDKVYWADQPADLAQYSIEPEHAKSATFIPALVTDNQELLKRNPEYLGNLKALSHVDRARLLDGNWKIRPAAGLYFPRADSQIIERRPDDSEVERWVRSWDLAATEPTENTSPDWTAGVMAARRKSDGAIIVAHVERCQKRSSAVRALVLESAKSDPSNALVRLPQDPGQAGKAQGDDFARTLQGFPVKIETVSKNKIARAEPAASQWQLGNVILVRGPWNEAFLAELEQFPDGAHDDQVDAFSDAFNTSASGARSGHVESALPRNEFRGMSDESSDHLSAMV